MNRNVKQLSSSFSGYGEKHIPGSLLHSFFFFFTWCQQWHNIVQPLSVNHITNILSMSNILYMNRPIVNMYDIKPV